MKSFILVCALTLFEPVSAGCANLGGWLYSTEGAVSSLAYSPDGQFVATCNKGPTIEVFSADTGSAVKNISVPTGCASLAYSPSGESILCGSNTALYVINATTGMTSNNNIIKTIKTGIVTTTISSAHLGWVSKVMYSNSDAIFASVYGNEAKVWNSAGTLLLDSGITSCASLSPDGQELAACTNSGVTVYDVASGSAGSPIKWGGNGKPYDAVLAGAYSGFLTTSWLYVISQSGNSVANIPTYSATSIFSDGDSVFGMLHADGSVRVVDAKSPSDVATFCAEGEVTSGAFGKGATRLAVVDGKGWKMFSLGKSVPSTPTAAPSTVAPSTTAPTDTPSSPSPPAPPTDAPQTAVPIPATTSPTTAPVVSTSSPASVPAVPTSSPAVTSVPSLIRPSV